jgi:hypothetical protein
MNQSIQALLSLLARISCHSQSECRREVINSINISSLFHAVGILVFLWSQLCVGATTYRVITFTGVSADPSIDLFGGEGAGGLGGIHTNPNDAGIAYGIANYRQAGILKFGTFRYDSGKWYLVSESAHVNVITNDGGDALVTVTDFVNPMNPSSTQYFVSRAGTTQTLAPPSGVLLRGITNDGRFLRLGSGEATFFDSTFSTQTNIPGSWDGYGRDGLLYFPALPGNLSGQSVSVVRFVDGASAILPCNPATFFLVQPASGRNCRISAASASGIVAGLFYSSDGRRGVFRFSKNGFEEVVIDPQYWGLSTDSPSTTPGPTPVSGVANDGTVLLAPAYIDPTKHPCIGGPFVVRGSAVTDLKQFIPGNSCFNVRAGISGGGRVFLSSQAQGANLYLELVPTAPDAPTAVSAGVGSGSITVSFGAPANDGGASITEYTATCTSSNGGVSGSNTGGGSATSIRVSGLTNGKNYACTVTASNTAGAGAASAPSNAITPFDLTPILTLLLDDTL